MFIPAVLVFQISPGYNVQQIPIIYIFLGTRGVLQDINRKELMKDGVKKVTPTMFILIRHSVIYRLHSQG